MLWCRAPPPTDPDGDTVKLVFAQEVDGQDTPWTDATLGGGMLRAGHHLVCTARELDTQGVGGGEVTSNTLTVVAPAV